MPSYYYLKFINFSIDIYISSLKNQREKKKRNDQYSSQDNEKQLVHIGEFQYQKADMALFIYLEKKFPPKKKSSSTLNKLQAHLHCFASKIFYNLPPCNFTRLPSFATSLQWPTSGYYIQNKKKDVPARLNE